GVQNTTCVSIGGQPGTLQASSDTITVSSSVSAKRALVQLRTRATAAAWSGLFVVKPSMATQGQNSLFARPRRWAFQSLASVPIPKFASVCGTLVRTSESIRTLATVYSCSAAFEPEVRIYRLRNGVQTWDLRHYARAAM